MYSEKILPTIKISDRLFEAIEEWRKDRIPIPTKSEAVRTILREALEVEE